MGGSTTSGGREAGHCYESMESGRRNERLTGPVLKKADLKSDVITFPR